MLELKEEQWIPLEIFFEREHYNPNLYYNNNFLSLHYIHNPNLYYRNNTDLVLAGWISID